jgi:hypothetical protein
MSSGLFGSAALEIAIGLSFTYLLVSIPRQSRGL